MNMARTIGFCLLLTSQVAVHGIEENSGSTQSRANRISEGERLGIQAEKEGRFEDARKEYEAVCRLDADWGEYDLQPFGDASALLKLARLLRDPKCGTPDPTRAGRCYVAALGIGRNQWCAQAWIELINMYRVGDGVPKDQAFADHLLGEFRFKAGNTHWSKEDSLLLATMLERGDFLPRNFLMASDQYYLYGDKAAALKALQRAADEGDPFAYDKLAWSYKGFGWVVTDTDLKKSEECLQRAAALRAKTIVNAPKPAPGKPKTVGRAWTGSAGPPQGDSDELLGEEKHRELFKNPGDPVRAFYHLLWAEYLTPKG